MTIPVFRPQLAGEPATLLATLRSNWWGTGPRVAQFEADFAGYVGTAPAQCLMLTSCTAALHLAVKLYPDASRILVPGLTFISSALPALYEGKELRFVEVSQEDLCIDQEDVLRYIESEKDVVIAVHLGGHVADLKKLPCNVIEDCAHALGSWYDEGKRHVGSENAGCFSFQATKGMPIGDGGMLVLPPDTPRAPSQARSWCGIGESTWDRTSAEYRWAYGVEEVGYKYRANDLAGALAIDQWRGMAADVYARQRIAALYNQEFADLPWLRLPSVRQGTRPNWQEYIVQTSHRDALHQHLAGRGISTTVHYHPINLYASVWGVNQVLPRTEALAKKILTIPCFASMTEQEQERVVDGVRSFRP